jgi:DNA-binding HxlR family transcriptional regulator
VRLKIQLLARNAESHITNHVLTLQLRDGLMANALFVQMLSQVEYALTASAQILIPFFDGLQVWGDEHRHAAKDTPVRAVLPVNGVSKEMATPSP